MQNRKCKNCKSILADVKFCGYCGAKVENKSSKVIPIFGLIGVLAIGSIFSNKSNKIIDNRVSPNIQSTSSIIENAIKPTPNYIGIYSQSTIKSFNSNYSPSESPTSYQPYIPPPKNNYNICVSPCGDGSCSGSTGRGTCSHHGV